MKILLIIPKYNLTNKSNYGYAFPLGLGYIYSVMKQAGHEVDCLNLNHLNGATEELIKDTLDKKCYNVVETGHMGIGYSIVEKIIDAVRNHSSNPKIIIGGALITSESELMFNSLKPDVAVLGEGELTIIQLLNCLEKKGDLKKVNGICYNENGKVVFTESRELIKDLDSLPFPDLEGLEFEKFLDHQTSGVNYGMLDYPRTYPILCSRGCPYQCTFCYHSIGFKYRIRSLDSIFKELKFVIEKYNINNIIIYDDLFSLNKDRLFEFCKRIKKLSKENNCNLTWSCQITVKDVDEELLKTLKDSGCNVISYGFESFSEKILKSMKKPITPYMIENAFKKTLESGISIQANFIFGDTAETKETAKETIDWWKNNSKGQIQLGFIQPYPGSRIFEKCVEKGAIKDKLDFIKNKINYITWLNMTDQMTDQEFLEMKEEIFDLKRKYYPYATPLSIKKTGKNIFEIEVKCPFCKNTIKYKNWLIENKYHYTIFAVCRHCPYRFYIVSPFKMFQINNHKELEFFRKNYVFIRDSILKKQL